MSRVDYASSSDDDLPGSEHESPQQLHELPASPPPRPPSSPKTQASSGCSFADQKPETFEKLPDASMLLNSPTVSLVSGNDHASIVVAAVAESASRKQDSKDMMGLGSTTSVSVPPSPRAKLPRATIPHSKSVHDTEGGALIPPQLKGRSNVVTEDIGKLFVSRHAVAKPRVPEN
ncbi:uncharacterized protein LOC111310074 [Durio zibethinus]|uniref:Uncharacterized protein LOC111310074 n=1 Tax=Durio zibethinus TaxID=66656 RepID=A0A6P6AJ84_DURZI|nr:uncharacterized protein LOC111310074 [Durio zibethinus]